MNLENECEKKFSMNLEFLWRESMWFVIFISFCVSKQSDDSTSTFIYSLLECSKWTRNESPKKTTLEYLRKVCKSVNGINSHSNERQP